ncbi:DUF2851 family protein [Aureibaculum sp. 2210JD6-5]|uniref:DUF2851 family protein n=1 Tax=Aureibaculum sp. 2210JD6-5 TaxID=3103957 RepID=UPI002AACEF64|nr:DUF2851 family protein [Aureibaculum sp. 2210JD6-5]MDY7395495.1 DUF2851 family protein [Aureibaculum sp. 2210JD6-5]
MIKEDFLHYIWKYKLFSTENLLTTQKETVVIKNCGEHNFNSGSDFFNAKLVIGNQLWAGNVEIHIKSSDWYVHGHEKDSNYDNTILHVVWQHDVDVHRKDNSTIPTLILENYIKEDVLHNYLKLFSSQKKWINCENDIGAVDKFQSSNWLERLYIERLEEKSKVIEQLLLDSKNDWEAVLFKMLAKNFGLKVNGEAFFSLANRLDYTVVRKQLNNANSLEALLFGQANLLGDDVQDQYHINLKNEYDFLKSKYKLTNNLAANFQFFRLRPNNFPTIRIAQLAALFNKHQKLFSKIMTITDAKEYYQLFNIDISNFWKTHYSFTSKSKKSNKKLTKSFVDLLLINTVIPLKFMYLKSIDKLNETEIIESIQQLKPEKNNIIEKFNQLEITSSSALETQALLQLKNEYCAKKRCLECTIGRSLIA